MENRRLQWFLVAIGAGLVLGLILGWSMFARKAADLQLQDLREDYQVDYVLMVATIYGQDKDLAAARARLMPLAEDTEEMIDLVKQAMATPAISGVSNDLQALGLLLNALQGAGAAVPMGVMA
ncbi:MAG: hypothetical protein HPY85_00435 [Anaerolineae bacterium]|nr:hypothetical protein [Anaerolineae bacterium]